MDKNKKILLIGSGMMAETVIDYLLKRKENLITIASNIEQDALSLAQKNQRCKSCYINVSDEQQLRSIVKDHDIVISFIPPFLHKFVGKACLEEKRNMVTSSYVQPEIWELNDQIIKQNLIFMNEVGLDPGLDHIMTMKVLEEARLNNGKIIEYESFCGGLPCPDVCDNPLGYKFSWSPQGALVALKNSAQFLKNNKIEKIEQSDVLYHSEERFINMAFNIEGYPNRDSLKYKDLYGLNDSQTILRGTLRYKGFSMIIRAIIAIDLLTSDPLEQENKMISFKELISVLVSNADVSKIMISQKKIEDVLTKINIQQKDWDLAKKILVKTLNNKFYKDDSEEELINKAKKILAAFKWLEFFSEEKIVNSSKSPFDNIVTLFERKLQYQKGERDCVILQNYFHIQYPDKEIKKQLSLILFGIENGQSAMALCVGTPTAIACQLILDGVIKTPGVHLPNLEEIYKPIYAELEKVGIKFKEQEL